MLYYQILQIQGQGVSQILPLWCFMSKLSSSQFYIKTTNLVTEQQFSGLPEMLGSSCNLLSLIAADAFCELRRKRRSQLLNWQSNPRSMRRRPARLLIAACAATCLLIYRQRRERQSMSKAHAKCAKCAVSRILVYLKFLSRRSPKQASLSHSEQY